VQVPEGAAKGKAKVTLSFPNWKEGRVAPATFEFEVADAPASEQSRPVASPPSGQNGDAQRRSGPGPTRTEDNPVDNAGSLVKLLIEKSVHDELKLSERQLKGLPEFRLNLYKKGSAAGIPVHDQEVWQLFRREYADMVEKELKRFLSSDQYKRLRQIDLQVRAAEGWGLVTILRGTEVAGELNLSEAQKETLTAIRQDILDTFVKRAGAGGREGWERTLAEYRQGNNDKIERMLTDAQRAKWKEMIGAEFKGKIDSRR